MNNYHIVTGKPSKTEANQRRVELRVTQFQYCDIIRFTVLHNRHHKVSRSSCNAKPLLLILLRTRVNRGHFVMSIIKNRESHYVTVLDNPPESIRSRAMQCRLLLP